MRQLWQKILKASGISRVGNFYKMLWLSLLCVLGKKVPLLEVGCDFFPHFLATSIQFKAPDINITRNCLLFFDLNPFWNKYLAEKHFSGS